MEGQKNKITISLGMAVCLTIIFILVVALAITFYFGFIKEKDNVNVATENVVANTITNTTVQDNEIGNNTNSNNAQVLNETNFAVTSNTPAESNTVSTANSGTGTTNSTSVNTDGKYVGTYKLKKAMDNNVKEVEPILVFGSSVKYGIGLLTLNSDKTFKDEVPPLFNDENDRKGTYSVDGETISLKYASGVTQKITYNSNDNTIKYGAGDDDGYYLILEPDIDGSEQLKQNVKSAFLDYLDDLQKQPDSEELEEFVVNEVKILSEKEKSDIMSIDKGQTYKQSDILAEVTYTVRPKNIKNTGWTAGNGTINGDFITKYNNVVYRNNKIVSMATSW